MAFLDRIASAPISWGICEVPGWGHMLPTDRVLTEMTDLGITATEYGAPGFLPTDPDDIRAVLDRHGMSLLGGFTPLVLHDPARRDSALARVRAGRRAVRPRRRLDLRVVPGHGRRLVRAPAPRPRRAPATWSGCSARSTPSAPTPACGRSCTPTSRPSSRPRPTSTASSHDCDVAWCLDTGHLAIGGTDPVEFARQAADRVGHVHLKDVRMDLVPRMLDRSTSIMEGVQAGPLPARSVRATSPSPTSSSPSSGPATRAGTSSSRTPRSPPTSPPRGEGPVNDVRDSMRYLRDVVAPLVEQGA